MKKATLILFATLFIPYAAHADDNAELLERFHEYGITKCDNFILENSKLVGNWTYYINKHADGIDGPVTEVTLIRIWGSENDTVKTDDSFIQSPKNCYLTRRTTLTNPGSCESVIDGKWWYVSNPIPNRDYATYTNKGGVAMQAKDITVGNFSACVQESMIRSQAPHD